MNENKEPKPHRYLIALSLRKPLLDAIEEHARAANITRSRLVDMILWDYFMGEEKPSSENKEEKDEYKWAVKSTKSECVPSNDDTCNKETSIDDDKQKI